MRIIGILGGVASGKSLVAERFRQFGAGLLDGDAAGHAVLLQGDVEQAARERWGAGIFGPDGHIERPRLAKIVFAGTDEARRELAHLEKLTHPRIGRLLSEWAEEWAKTHEFPILVLDAPVMLKAGWDELCDRIVFVDAPREARLARALARGWSAADFSAREASQEPLDVKKSKSHDIIDNSGSPEQTRAQVDRLWANLVG